MEKTEIKFDRPVKFDGKETKRLTMREPTVADQIAAQESAASANMQEVILIANLCEVSPDDVRVMPVREYLQLQEAYRDFL